MRVFFPAFIFGMISPALWAATPAESEFFEKQVRPVLAEHCYSCHGPKKQKAELRLDSREALLKGSDVGPVVVPGKPEESSFIKSIRHEGDSKMPEKEDKLPEEQIAALTEWVRMGLPWPEGEAANLSAQEEAAKKHWSFQKVRKPAPPVVETAADRIQSPIDRFILARLAPARLSLAKPADKHTLLRRATFDLTGLPPTTAEIEAFEKDASPEAFARVVDRLLASPRYGERWGRYWLDVARYADSKGYVFQEERRYPYAYTYRDWVIQALNADLPYNQFLLYQLAADQLVTKEDPEPLAAMGFLTLGRRFLNNPHDIIDDRIDVVTRGLMGLTVACARCHDHKFDPILAKDYYALYGVFASSTEPNDAPLLSGHRDPQVEAEYQQELARRQAKVDALLESKQARRSVLLATASYTPAVLPLDVLERTLPRDERDEVRNLRKKIDELNAGPLAPPRPMMMADKPEPVKPRIFVRGNPGRPGDEIPRQFITVLSDGEPKPFEKGSGRLEMAQAIASAENPLTARVLVNRVWMLHFGAGLVRTPGDFGVKGEPPTHPELLDWLAANFVEQGWSLKQLHREIMLSSTYQQSSDTTSETVQADPENRLLTRMNRRRLDFEAMRDSLLSVTGQLDPKMGGRAEQLFEPPYSKRRAVYGFIDRQNLPGTFRTFDFASPDATSPQRYSTTVPQQALFMLNSPFVTERARALVSRPEYQSAASEWQVQALYEQVLGRRAEDQEVNAALRFLSKPVQEEPAPTPLWQYGFGYFDETTGKVAFQPLPHWTGRGWQGGEKLPDPKSDWAVQYADGGHAGGPQQAVIRRWTAPRDAVITISGKLAKPSENGDGVRARIVSSTRGQLGAFVAEPKGSTETPIEKTEVKAGETIDFIVESMADTNSDSFTWAPLIRSDAGEWDAKLAFSGPTPPPLPRLTLWEQYAQVLLAANEFVFVD